MKERRCCGTLEGTPHRSTCRPYMLKEIDRLTAQLAERDKELQHWRANHADLKQRLAFANQRPDLPVDRIPAYEEMQKQLAERDAEIARLQQQSVGWVAVFDENASLREQLQQAHRQGWEQCRAEILAMLKEGSMFYDDTTAIETDIAGMEYKETNDESV